MASTLNNNRAVKDFNYSTDKRKRKNQHRTAARQLLTQGGLFNSMSAVGSTFWEVAQWHLNNARYL